MKQVLAILALLVLAFLFAGLVPPASKAGNGAVGNYYAAHGIADNRGSNLVTSIVVNYRGLDTLGEVTVLFLSVMGVGFILRRREGTPKYSPVPASPILNTGANLLFGSILLLGAYIFVHGHLTPGGGFQGGSVIASGVLLLILARRDRELSHDLLAWLESLSGFGYALVGLVGLFVAGSFLANKGVLPLGTWNRLFSAGVIPIIYILIGLKVGAELSTLLDIMIREPEPAAEGGAH